MSGKPLSAEAPEFVPRLGSIQTTTSVQHQHQHQQPTNAIGHSIYRNNNHGSAQNYPVTFIFFYIVSLHWSKLMMLAYIVFITNQEKKTFCTLKICLRCGNYWILSLFPCFPVPLNYFNYIQHSIFYFLLFFSSIEI